MIRLNMTRVVDIERCAAEHLASFFVCFLFFRLLAEGITFRVIYSHRERQKINRFFKTTQINMQNFCLAFPFCFVFFCCCCFGANSKQPYRFDCFFSSFVLTIIISKLIASLLILLFVVAVVV